MNEKNNSNHLKNINYTFKIKKKCNLTKSNKT